MEANLLRVEEDFDRIETENLSLQKWIVEAEDAKMAEQENNANLEDTVNHLAMAFGFALFAIIGISILVVREIYLKYGQVVIPNPEVSAKYEVNIAEIVDTNSDPENVAEELDSELLAIEGTIQGGPGWYCSSP